MFSSRTGRHTIPVSRYTMSILDEMKAQFDRVFSEAVASNRRFLSIAIVPEPFAQPNVRQYRLGGTHIHLGRFLCPSVMEFHYVDEADDEFFIDALFRAQQAIQARAIEEGQSFPDDVLYNNYAPADTPLELLYGDNLERLREIKRRVDPENIMSLAGGFKIDP
ncbi:hypothetical protein MPER_08297 [Moniliophthora perniciosa FA553]|nr:hypothetical protein MPER_08297 [Moniliophthora perniciosa FA553]